MRTATPTGSSRYYQLATSASAGVIPLGYRDIRLACDALCLASATNTARHVFRQYFGSLDRNGEGSAAIEIPNLPALVGARLHTAFAIIDPTTGAIGTISNTVVMEIEN